MSIDKEKLWSLSSELKLQVNKAKLVVEKTWKKFDELLNIPLQILIISVILW